MTLALQRSALDALNAPELVDISHDTMAARMIKSAEELELIRAGARTADIGGAAIKTAIREGATEIELAMLGRNAMEVQISRAYPDAEYRDTWGPTFLNTSVRPGIPRPVNGEWEGQEGGRGEGRGVCCVWGMREGG